MEQNWECNCFLTKMPRQFNGGKNRLSTSDAGIIEYLHAKDWNLECHFIPCTKINSKWSKNLNLTSKTIKLLGEKRVINLCVALGLGNGFLIWCQMHKQQEEKINE